MRRNRYYVCSHDGGTAIPWDPYAGDPDGAHACVELGYLRDTFIALERTTGVSGRTFYVTWDLDVLPAYGDDVIVFLMGDEWCRPPAYRDRVGAIFRQYGTRPALVTAGASPLSAVAVLQFLRAHAAGLPRRSQQALRRAASPPYRRAEAPQHVIPLGYGNQDELPVTPITRRGIDVYFSGSISNDDVPLVSLRRWLPGPKRAARTRMVAALRDLAARRSDLRIVLDVKDRYVPNAAGAGGPAGSARPAGGVAGPNGPHGPGDARAGDPHGPAGRNGAAGPRSYSATMMDTRICVVPRGSTPDTLRLFEALRYGCVVVADRLPSRWFYRDAPIVTVAGWQSLEAVVDGVLHDEARLIALHHATLDFWRQRCSGAALAAYVAGALDGPGALRAPRPSGMPVGSGISLAR